ncbi:MAG: hypothetical protein QGD92_15220, partial [Gammaproteobacteria bacterium]|nr:hypothetical protein [Gammaproteobacteria bacterium]
MQKTPHWHLTSKTRCHHLICDIFCCMGWQKLSRHKPPEDIIGTFGVEMNAYLAQTPSSWND